MDTINLFFLEERRYECIVTTKEEISESYHRKITVALEKAKEWEKGTLVGRLRSVGISNPAKYNDDDNFYIDVKEWTFDSEYKKPGLLYIAIHKSYLDGGEYRSANLEQGIGNEEFGVFLFPKKN